MMKRQFGSLTISPGETLEPRLARRLGAGGELGFDIGCETVSKDRKDYPKRGGESLPLCP